jgi:DNA-binding PadR family transcriptional regulator
MPSKVKVRRKPVLTNPVTIPAVVLHLLDAEGDSYGQRLLDSIRERTNNKVMARWGSMYPALAHLEEDGLIESVGQPKAGESGRTRRVYKITRKGREKAAENREVVLKLFGGV